MKIKLNTIIKDQNGKPLGKDIPCLVLTDKGEFAFDKGELMQRTITDKKYDKTLKDIIKTALLNEPANQTGADKVKCYDLYEKIVQSNGKVDLETDDVKIIKDKITDSQGTLIMGHCHRLIEGKEPATETVTKDAEKTATESKNGIKELESV